jgi:uncharacterized protein YdeI (YjbR/CyaY-like superfamily)
MPTKVSKTSSADLPIKPFKDQKAWADWLAKNHAKSGGLWLQLAKAASGQKSITYAEALEIALCYGWIDGQKKGYDEASWIQKFTPRRARSIWSKINREKALALIKSGQMQPAGLKAIETAKANGQWEAAYESQKGMTVPEDFATALEGNPKAKAFFATLNSTNRYAILFRLQTAKKPETREKRIKQFVEMLAKGEKLYP